MSDLLPCPFCQSPAERTDLDCGGSVIQCSRCMASSAIHYDRTENLLDSWNQRSSGVDAVLAELEQVLDYKAECQNHCARLEAELAEARATLQAYEASPGVVAIARERRRQIVVEGWTDEHDAGHSAGELELAASCYAELAAVQLQAPDLAKCAGQRPPANWPWEPHWWKPSTPARNLERAGALIAAALDRHHSTPDGAPKGDR